MRMPTLAGFASGLLFSSTLLAQGLPDFSVPAVASPPLAVAPRAEPDAQGLYVVDVLVLYTPATGARLGGGGQLSALAATLIDDANRYFANSLMPVQYRLVGVAKSSATADDGSKDYAANLQDLAASGAVRQQRNQAGADLVALLRANDSNDECGMATLFNGGEQSDPPANVNPERDAFAVIGAAPSADGVSCIDLEHTFAHELGHVMGGGHQYLAIDGVPGPYWKPYAHGSYCGFASDGTRNNTVMMGGVGFANGPYAQGGDLRGDYFSNPRLTVDGAPCGVDVTGTTEAETDNARSISEAAPYIALYRSAGAGGAADGVPTGKAGDSSGVVMGGAMAVLELLLLGMGTLVRRRRR